MGAAWASVRYSTAMSEKDSPSWTPARESTRPASNDRCERPPTSPSMVWATHSASAATEAAACSPSSGASGSSRAGSIRRPLTSVDGAMAWPAAAMMGAVER